MGIRKSLQAALLSGTIAFVTPAMAGGLLGGGMGGLHGGLGGGFGPSGVGANGSFGGTLQSPNLQSVPQGATTIENKANNTTSKAENGANGAAGTAGSTLDATNANAGVSGNANVGSKLNGSGSLNGSANGSSLSGVTGTASNVAGRGENRVNSLQSGTESAANGALGNVSNTNVNGSTQVSGGGSVQRASSSHSSSSHASRTTTPNGNGSPQP